jgi:hypothetical protein
MMVMPAFAVTTAHTFVLTVSHVCCSADPILPATAHLPPLLFELTTLATSAKRPSIFPLPNV